KNLDVLFEFEMKFHKHVYTTINKFNSILGLINRHFKNLFRDSFVTLSKSLVRSKIEYAACVWSLWSWTDKHTNAI
ncbi:hypothetical protein HELRODRAFT_62878, partial [Helobdella robusta]|uniref:Uncharacterized protein n=1 Tax=Helobdella robusta TaxID=6412 RepID=T1FX64_HELRO